MSDVASVAGVGISTVSNALNHPHKVAPTTLQRVRQAIAELDFRPSEEAVKLRQGKKANKARSGPNKVPPPTAPSPAPRKSAKTSPEESVTGPEGFLCLLPGTRVDIMDDGIMTGSGVVDMSAPDGSSIWLWMDCGAGRRLIHCFDGLELRKADHHA